MKNKKISNEEIAENMVRNHKDFKAEGFSDYMNGYLNGIIAGLEYKQQGKKYQFKNGDDIRCIIKHKGAPIVNGGYVREIGKNIVALEIDLRSKYCEMDSWFGGSGETVGVYISATDISLNLNKKVKIDEPTSIEFPDFKGWDVFSGQISKYTLRLCLIRVKH